MSVFEIGMLVCFGFAWPTAIHKSIKSRSIQGKSILFIYVILIGYIFGIIHKFIYNLDFVVILYIVNLVMVFIDLLLYYKNKKISIENEVI